MRVPKSTSAFAGGTHRAAFPSITRIAKPPQQELPVADETRRESDEVKGPQRVPTGDPASRGESSDRLAVKPNTEQPDPTGRDDTDARQRQSRR
jgi:hypothetical protein